MFVLSFLVLSVLLCFVFSCLSYMCVSFLLKCFCFVLCVCRCFFCNVLFDVVVLSCLLVAVLPFIDAVFGLLFFCVCLPFACWYVFSPRLSFLMV